MLMKILAIVFLFSFFTAGVYSQDELQVENTLQKILSNKWYEKLQIRGYMQFRYNRSFESNRDLKCSQCDKSIGDKNGFFLRRGRIILFGQVSDRLFVYIQPDYGSSTGSGTDEKLNYLQIRDAYFDYALTDDKLLRVRAGISKVPYGFENLQSSSNRPALDRADPLNSGVPNERDQGVYLMWETQEGKDNLRDMLKNNLKGSGDYGMVTFGVMNGQTLNQPERNNGLHSVMRLAYPMKTKSGQFMEFSASGYAGKFVLKNGEEYLDERQNVSFVYFPQPIGFQIELTQGIGPEYQQDLGRVTRDKLSGGYVQMMYQFYNKQTRFYPYMRFQQYEGGKKMEEGRAYIVHEWEAGVEISPDPSFELTLAAMKSDRLTRDSSLPNNHQNGHALRIQAQINY